MKNINKLLIFSVIAGTLLCCAPAIAVQASDTTISIASVNNSAYFDIEIMPVSEGKILLPLKQLADILEVPVKINHSTKEITFDNVKVSKDAIFIGGVKIPAESAYLKKGIMSDIQDEIFIDEKTLSKIFNTEISTNKNELSVIITSSNALSYLGSDETGDETEQDVKKFRAYKDVLVPEERKRFTLDTIGFNNYMNSDNTKQVYLNETTTNALFNNNSNITLKGRAFDGDYNVDFNSNNHTEKFFSFGGLSFKYKNKYKNIPYEIGRVTGFEDEKFRIGTSLLGVQVFNYDSSEKDYRYIDGNVDENSVVNIYINDEFYKTLDTYKGYFSLKDVYTDKKIEKITIEELKDDGSTKTVYEKIYPKNKSGLSVGERRYSMLAGVSGFNDRLFSQNGYIYQMNTKKFVLGTQYQQAISEKLNYDVKVAADKIIQQDANTIWGQSYYNNHSILSSGTYKNPNILEGASVINTWKYDINDDLRISSDMGVSYSNEGSGHTASVNAHYSKENYNLKASLYEYSPNFYLAGSESGFISDRLGGYIGGDYKYKQFNLSTGLNKYFSNIDKNYDGGVISYTDGSLGMGLKLPKIANFRFSSNFRQGENTIGESYNYHWDFNVRRNFKYFNLEAGRRDYSYNTEYFSSAKNSENFESFYSTLYAKADIKIPKNKGTLMLGHDIVNNTSNGRSNNYSAFKIGYTFPEIKRILLSTNVSMNYTGSNKGFNYGAGIGYRTKSGMVISLNYQYNVNGGYIFDNMYIPANNRHSFNLTFNDTLAVVQGSGLKSVGYADADKGYVEIIAFIDKNGNGKFDKGDIGVRNVPIKTSWNNKSIYTGRNGIAPIEVVDKGVGKVTLDISKLSGTFSAKSGIKDSQMVLIKPKSTTRVEFPLLCSVGGIQGNLKVVSDFSDKLNISEFVVVLHNENAQEVAYSTLDEFGNYYFSGISPGKYVVKLDEVIQQVYGLDSFENKGEINVEIPYVQDEFVDIKDINLIYKN